MRTVWGWNTDMTTKRIINENCFRVDDILSWMADWQQGAEDKQCPLPVGLPGLLQHAVGGHPPGPHVPLLAGHPQQWHRSWLWQQACAFRREAGELHSPRWWRRIGPWPHQLPQSLQPTISQGWINQGGCRGLSCACKTSVYHPVDRQRLKLI